MKFLLFLIVFALSAANDLVYSSNTYNNSISLTNNTRNLYNTSITIISDMNKNNRNEELLTEEDIHNSLGDYKNIAVIDKNLTPVNPYIIRMLSLSTLLCLTTTLTPDSNVLIIYDTYTTSFQFFQISDPLSPYILSTINLDASSSGRAIATSSDGETIFLTMNCGDYEGQLLIADFSSDTASLTVLSVFSVPYNSYSIALSPDDKTLFVGTSGDNSAVITTIDVSNPKSPRNISSILNYGDPSVWPPLPGGFRVEIAISPDGNYLFITDTCNWHILDISNLDSPSYLNTTIGDCTDGAIDVTIAPDGDTAFVLTSNSNLNSSSLHIIDLSTLKVVQTVEVGPFIQYYYDALLAASPDNQNVLITGSENLIVVNVSDINNPNSYTIDTILNPNRIIIAQDSQTAFMTTSDNQVAILGLYFDSQLSTQNKILSNISANISSSLLSSMAISSDSKTVLMQYSSYLEIIDVTYRSSPNSLSIYNIPNSISGCYSVTISPDDKTIFMMCNSEILILDISSLTQPTLLTTFSAEPTPGGPFVVSSNGQVGFFSIDSGLQIINISDPTLPSNIHTYDFSDDFTSISLTLTQNDQVAFMLGSTLEGTKEYQVMNLEELTSPDLIVTSEIDAYGDACSIAASSEEQLAIVVTCTGNTSNFIVFNTVLLDDADEIGSFNWAFNIFQPIIFSKYSSLIYILTNTQLLIAEITTTTPLNLLRAFPVEDAISMKLSNDELTAFLGLKNGTLVIVDLEAPYALYMVKSNIMLGEVYSNHVIPLIQESTIGFNPINESYAFVQASLISVSIPSNSSQAMTSYQALPSWINFDQNYGVLTFAPDAPSHLGSYQIYIAISTLIPTDAFVGIGPISNETDSLQLVVSLMSLGYINTKRFLTSDFNPTGELFLTSEYSLYGSEIQAKLSQYYIGMTKSVSVISSLSSNQITSVAINSSLSSTYSQRFVVSALSHSTISLKMTLDTMGDGKIQFVNSDYPAMTSLSEDQSTITLEGFLSDVNNALSQLIINLNDTNDSDCYADFDANDGINLSDDDMIFFITNFFIINEAPVLNPNFSIQAEIDQTPIIMGGQFIIDISNMFTDPNGLELEYSLSMQDSTQYVPQWLMLRGQTIIGSPPDQLSSLQMSLVITAQKQFKSVSQTFTINVEMSLGYTLRQIATLIGPTVTLIGLWIYIRKIYNVCCKKRYKYPKEFVIKVGDKESVQGVCGITFIKEEARISKLVFEEMRGFIARESRRKSVSKKEFIAYFINSQSRQLEEPKLERTIKYGISRVDDNNLYLRKEVIKQLILNEIAKQQLNFKEESLTKQLFNTIKDDWMNLIEMTNDTLLFELNSDKLEKKLESVGITSYHSRKDRELEILADDPNKLTSPFLSMHTSKKVRDSSKLDSDLQPASRHSDNFSRKGSDKRKDFSLKETDINFSLLEKAINAYAFKYHSLYVNPIDIKVRINEKIKSTSIFRKVREFFKLDLSRAKFFGKGEAGHGLNYKVQNNIWRLFGIPEETLKNKTLVIQITNKRGRILRELLIKCLPADHEE